MKKCSMSPTIREMQSEPGNAFSPSSLSLGISLEVVPSSEEGFLLRQSDLHMPSESNPEMCFLVKYRFHRLTIMVNCKNGVCGMYNINNAQS